MNVLLISESFIIREALGNLFKEFFNIREIIIASNLLDIEGYKLNEINFLFVDMKENSDLKLDFLTNVKESFNQIKVMTLDLNKDENVCKKLIDIGVEAYITDIGEKDDFKYTINKILRGKNIYSSEVTKSIICSSNKCDISILTPREIDVLSKIADGFKNKEIATLLHITEYTVKKHVSSILYKLNLRDRKEAIIYYKELNIKVV